MVLGGKLDHVGILLRGSKTHSQTPILSIIGKNENNKIRKNWNFYINSVFQEIGKYCFS